MAKSEDETPSDGSHFMRSFVLVIQEELTRRRLQISEFAALSGISEAEIEGVLKLNCDLSLVTVEQICCALDISLDDVFRRQSELSSETKAKIPVFRPSYFSMPYTGE